MPESSEPWVPEPPPREPRYEERELPLCPDCKGLARREILALTAEGAQHGPWRCDLHGELTHVEWETMEVPAGD